MFLPSTQSFSLVRRRSVSFDISADEDTTVITQEEEVIVRSRVERTVKGRPRVLLPSTHSFALVRPAGAPREVLPAAVAEAGLDQAEEGEATALEGKVVGDADRRTFLKAAGVAGAGLVASQLFPKQAQALVLGSSPTTGVVGVKNASNVRVNPATEETLSTLLKASDLTFDAGALEVKITGAGSTSFSDSGDVARSALVDGDRHVQVDVLSSALPASASTESTLQTISFGGYKFSLRLATVGDIDYVGEAAIGTATSAASWRIKKVDTTSGIEITWAGSGIFDQIWDNRASLSYS